MCHNVNCMPIDLQKGYRRVHHTPGNPRSVCVCVVVVLCIGCGTGGGVGMFFCLLVFYILGDQKGWPYELSVLHIRIVLL